MASNTFRKIVLKGSERDVYEEYTLNADAVPGHLMERMSSGNVRKHATAGGKWPRIVLANDRIQGATIDDTVLANQPAQCWHGVAGDVINCLVAASAAAIVIGDYVESAGDGTVRKHVPLVDNSGGTADGTIAAVTGAYVEATMENNTADLAAFIIAAKSNVIGYAEEAVDNSAGVTTARIAIRLI